MNIKVKCFSHVKYALGMDEMNLDLESGATTFDLENVIRKKAEGKLDGVSLRTAVNQTYFPEPVELNDGDEVAFIPPVQGG